MTLSIFSEEVQPAGTFNIQVFLDLLGRPMIDRMSVFIRETAQNSWDARLNILNGDVDFSIKIGTFSIVQSKILKEEIFPISEHARSLTELIHSHCKADSPYLIVRDCGTTGLAGPTEANAAGEKRNFTSFIRNIGQDDRVSEKTGRGGTFGFGKSVFFRISKTRTFIAYSRTTNENGDPVSRLIGLSLGKIEGTSYMYTGRHWWGIMPTNREHSKLYNQPLTGSAADELAGKIGFEPYKTAESGTSVMIIGPEFGLHSEDKLWEKPEGRERIAQLMHETLGFWYWPRSMGGGELDGKLNAKILYDGMTITLSAKDAKYPIPVFAECLEAIQSYIKGDNLAAETLLVKIFEIKAQRNKIGLLAIAKRAYRSREPHTINLVENHPLKEIIDGRPGDAQGRNTEPLCHHVALIREPGQVIRYLETTECSQNGMEYAGVFLLMPDGPDKVAIRESIKKSEPPSHDDWSKEELWAKLALTDISRNASRFASPTLLNQGSISDRAGKISLLLSSLWSSGEGMGGGDTNEGGGGGSKKLNVGSWTHELTLIDNNPHILYTLHPSNHTKNKPIICNLKAALYGGGSEDLPGGTESHFIGWYTQSESGKLGQKLTDKPAISINESMLGKPLLALVRVVENTAITATFKIFDNDNATR